MSSPSFVNGGESLGLPPEIAKRKNGLMSALMAIPEDQDAGMGTSQPSAAPMGDVNPRANAAPRPAMNDGGTATPQTMPRVEDDRPSRAQPAQPQSLAEKMSAGNYDEMQVGQPGPQQDPHLQQLQGEYDKLGQPRPPMKLWQKIALGASAPFGGLTSFVQERDRQNQQTQQERGGLLQQIEAERRMQEQEQGLDKRLTLQEKLRRDAEDATADRQQPEVHDTDQGPIQYDRQSKSWTPIQVGGQRVGPKAQPKPDSLDQQYDDAVTRGDTARSAQIKKEKSDLATAGQAPQRPPQQLAIGPDGKVIELRPGVQVPAGTKTVTADLKGATADEERRADLARNMNENLDQLEDIVKRRGDLFGRYAGRYTQLRQTLGTSDPDVAKLKAIHEYLGMASVGAHAMRNAQHIGEAADAVMGAFTNSPEATMEAVKTARQSIATFQQDAGQPIGSAPKANAGQQTATPKGKSSGAKLKDRVTGKVLVEGKDF